MQLPKEIITNPGINLGNPAYREYLERAKQDDPLGFTPLLEKILTPRRINDIHYKIGNTSDIMYAPIPPHAESKNFLPLRAAEFLQAQIGGKVSQALQLTHAEGKRRYQKFWERVLTPRKFELSDSRSLAEKRIYIVDDHFTTGGTARDAILALQRAGLPVESVITLGACFCRRLGPSDEQIQGFYGRFGVEGETLIRSITGLGPEELTYSELRGILKLRTLQELKERVQPGNLSILPLFQYA